MGPGASGCPARGGGPEEALVVGFDSAVLEGYFRRAAAAVAVRAALDGDDPMVGFVGK